MLDVQEMSTLGLTKILKPFSSTFIKSATIAANAKIAAITRTSKKNSGVGFQAFNNILFVLFVVKYVLPFYPSFVHKVI